jgi:hypothetical protein
MKVTTGEKILKQFIRKDRKEPSKLKPVKVGDEVFENAIVRNGEVFQRVKVIPGRCRRQGIIIALSKDKIGYSFLSTKEKPNKVDWEKGEALAALRAQGIAKKPPIPVWFQPQYDRFLERCQHYFKN